MFGFGGSVAGAHVWGPEGLVGINKRTPLPPGGGWVYAAPGRATLTSIYSLKNCKKKNSPAIAKGRVRQLEQTYIYNMTHVSIIVKFILCTANSETWCCESAGAVIGRLRTHAVVNCRETGARGAGSESFLSDPGKPGVRSFGSGCPSQTNKQTLCRLN